jgi:DNA-binding Lrp family transcriptional regulator
MAVGAYIFVEAEAGKALDVRTEVAKIAGVRSSHLVTGQFDVIAFAEVEDMKTLGEFIVRQIQRIPGVRRTTTNVVSG